MVNIAVFEWRRVFATRRGWMAMAAFGLIWLLVLLYIIAPAARYLSAPETSGLIDLLIGDRLEALRHWSTPEVALYWLIALYLLPFFAVIISADQMASDKVRGTLRYLLLRTSRTELYFGRFLGQSVLMLLLVTVTLASVLALIGYYNPERVSLAVKDLPLILFHIWLVLLPFVAMMALLSLLASSARQAIVYWIIVWIVATLVIGYVQRKYGPFPLLDWLLPGSQISSLIKHFSTQAMVLAAIPILHTLVLLAFGWWSVNRRDL
ncbi:MAG: ABC transporter permease [Gammaproteobacteria bacterium]|nr:ABC transporter permease [Gammaproteobacteria bacterium]